MAVRGKAVTFKASLVVTVPALLLGAGALLFERTPDVAADLEYTVVTNRLTGQSCLEFTDGKTPDGLRDLAC